MQLRKYKGYSHSIIGCKQKEGETVREYFARFINATLDVPEHDERLIDGAFTWGLLPGPLSQKLMGKKPLKRAELRQEDGEAAKQAYLNAMAARHHNLGHMDFRRRSRLYGKARRPQVWFRPFVKDDRHGRRPDVYTVSEKQQPTKSPKNRYCEYHKSKMHDTTNCSVLKKEMEEKQLKGDLVEIARSLRAKFDAENAKNTPREGVQPKEIFMIRSKKSREEKQREQGNIRHSVRALTFSVQDPRPEGWRGDNPLVIQASIRDVTIHRVYVDTRSSADIIYEHCFWLLPDRLKNNLRPTTGRLVGFIGHSLWSQGTIHLPLTITSHDRKRKKTALIDFVAIQHSVEHKIILGRTTLLKLGVVPSTMHGVMKFDTPMGVATVLAAPPKELQCFTVMKLAEITKEVKRPRHDPVKGKEVINERHPDQPVSIGRDLPSHIRKTMVDLLKCYKHAFSWTPTGMVGVERKIIEHKLVIKPEAKEVNQKKRVQGRDRNREINVEVAKLAEAGIVREEIFPT
ncbi:uncharacterized protein LOC111902400 [Lactuca sativa]|uniref:uncharacterized protein LOC111902400 n=1 Tax=Lactuca sativa TaxID=4236 RepID=UPI000CD9460E|nr:uncharacterized protein LOC111902400 [Lactuca sativa]